MDEVARLLAAATRSGTAPPVVSLSGQAGIGKTTLAIRVAHRIGDEFPDGQLDANLRAADACGRDPAEVLAGFLRDLGVPGTDIPEGIGEARAQAEPEALSEIAQLCGYLPLALRVAGARLVSRSAWKISWFAARLRDESKRLDLLKAGDLEVRASFALSYQSRDATEQLAFRMLSLLGADFPAWTSPPCSVRTSTTPSSSSSS